MHLPLKHLVSLFDEPTAEKFEISFGPLKNLSQYKRLA